MSRLVVSVHPPTEAGLRAARRSWEVLGGWLVALPDSYRVTDDLEQAIQWIRELTRDGALARWIATHEDLSVGEPPVVDAALVERMTGLRRRPASTPSGQLSLWGAS